MDVRPPAIREDSVRVRRDTGAIRFLFGYAKLPRCRRDRKELFYIAPDRRLMAAEVNVKGSTFEVGAVHPLFGPGGWRR